MMGPTQYSQWCVHVHPTRAGPKERAGFIEPPDTGSPSIVPRKTVPPIITLGMLPSLLGFATTALMASRRMKVRTISIDSDSKVPPDAYWAAQSGCVSKHQPQDPRRG